jgi:hypothetical protein
VLAQALVAGYWFGTQAWPGESIAGALGMAWGLSLATAVVLFIPYVWLSLRAAGVPPWPVFATLLRPLRASTVMGLSVWLVRGQLPVSWPPILTLLSLILLGVVIYGLLIARDLKSLLRLTA